jgi:hypothetical protein
MNIIQYVVENYNSLLKSSFDGEECVIVKEIRNSNEGWGHHDYEGIGINSEGKILWCYSSGCSCNGSCGMEHKNTEKVFELDGFDLSSAEINPEQLNLNSLQVEFSSY